jgi:dihydropteroate synthase
MVELAPEHHGTSRDPLPGDAAQAAALRMEEAGADQILLSADAWLPGVKRISEAEELRRLVPAWKRLRDKLAIPLGVATDKSAIAERAFEAGSEVVFDPAGLTTDPQLPKTVAQHDGGFIVGHSRGTPEGWPKLPPVKDPVPALLQELDAGLNRARRGNILPVSLVADPGLGFGMRREQNIEVLAHLIALNRLDVPLCIAASDAAASAAAALAAIQGAHLVRTTEVAAVRQACELADAILGSVAAKLADTPDSSVSRAARPRPER